MAFLSNTTHFTGRDAPTYKLIVDGTAVEEAIPVLGISIFRAFNKIATARLVIKDGVVGGGENKKTDFPIQNKKTFEPGQSIEIKIGHRGDNSYRAFTGIITGMRVRIRSATSKLIVDCRSKAYRMTLHPKNCYFEDEANGGITDSEVIGGLTQEYGLASDLDETGYKHSELVQYACSDWNFIVNRAEQNGLFVAINEEDEVVVKRPNFTQVPVEQLEYGRNIYEADLDLDIRRHNKGIKAQAWDHTSQELLDQEAISSAVVEPGNLSSDELAERNKAGVQVLNQSGYKLDGELQARADALFLREKIAKVQGRIKVKTAQKIELGTLVDLGSLGERFNGRALITGVRYEYSRESWMADIQLGYPNEWKMDQLLGPKASAGMVLPPISGLQIGIVTQIHNDPEDARRIKVVLPAIDPGSEGVWARLATLDAGSGRGTFFLPEVDDEVIVGFLGNDPKEAIILGMLHSATNAHPLAPEANNNLKGIFSRDGIKILFDEESKSLTIEAPENILLKSATVDLSGEGGEPVVLGETLDTKIKSFVKEFSLLVQALHTYATSQSSVAQSPPTGLVPDLKGAYDTLITPLTSINTKLVEIQFDFESKTHLSNKVKSE